MTSRAGVLSGGSRHEPCLSQSQEDSCGHQAKWKAATGEGAGLFPSHNHNGGDRAPAPVGEIEEGVIVGRDGDATRVAEELVKAIGRHRAWSREARGQQVPA